MNIFFTVDNEYVRYLSVTMASILYNCKKDNIINFFIISDSISNENKRKLEGLKNINNFNIEYLIINKEYFSKIKESGSGYVSNATNYRFLVASLKKDIDKCLFLDADLIVNRDISELYSENVDDYYFASVIDVELPDDINWVQKLPLAKDHKYVNTGVMLINLKKWREDKVEEKLFEYEEKYRDVIFLPDQDTLNIALGGKIKYLNRKWNAQPNPEYKYEIEKKEAFSEIGILHWAGPVKPWSHSVVNYSEYYWKYARISPFYEEIVYVNVITNIKNNSNISHNVINTKYKDRFSIADFIFSIENDSQYKTIRIFGIKITIKK